MHRRGVAARPRILRDRRTALRELCRRFSFSERDKCPVYLFDEGPGLEEIPVDAIPWTAPLSTTANLWLTSYAKWREGLKR